MIDVYWSAKGGVGTSVVAAATALMSAADGVATLLVDLDGDQPAILAWRRRRVRGSEIGSMRATTFRSMPWPSWRRR